MGAPVCTRGQVQRKYLCGFRHLQDRCKSSTVMQVQHSSMLHPGLCACASPARSLRLPPPYTAGGGSLRYMSIPEGQTSAMTEGGTFCSQPNGKLGAHLRWRACACALPGLAGRLPCHMSARGAARSAHKPRSRYRAVGASAPPSAHTDIFFIPFLNCAGLGFRVGRPCE